jgi:hypothetical protein
MGLDTSEREVRWLNELIAHEQADDNGTSENKGEADHG